MNVRERLGNANFQVGMSCKKLKQRAQRVLRKEAWGHLETPGNAKLQFGMSSRKVNFQAGRFFVGSETTLLYRP